MGDRGGIVCSQHGGCSPGECFALHHPPRLTGATADERCSPCKIREHEWCESPDVAGRLNRCCCGVTTRGIGDRAEVS